MGLSIQGVHAPYALCFLSAAGTFTALNFHWTMIELLIVGPCWAVLSARRPRQDSMWLQQVLDKTLWEKGIFHLLENFLQRLQQRFSRSVLPS